MTAARSSLRVLVAIANHGTRNRERLERLLGEYRAMTFDVDPVVLSDAPKDLGDDVEVRVGAPTGDPWSLPFAHRPLFADRADDYDLFVYSEDDTLLTQGHLEAFLDADALLPDDEVPGFLRYEVHPSGERSYSSIHSTYRWWPETAARRGGEVFASFSNHHSACYVLTRAQLRTAIDSGGFLVPPHHGRYDMLVSAATDPYTQCGLTRRICVSRVDAFLVAHLSNAYLGRLGIGEDEFRAQIDALIQIADGRLTDRSLLDPASRLPTSAWDVPTHPVRTRQVAGVGSPDRALSVCATSGAVERAVLGPACAITAIPLDAVLAAVARTRGITTTEPSFDAAWSSFLGETFPVILLHHSLHHVEDPVAVLRELAPLLASDGTLLATVPNTRACRLKRRLGRHAPPPPTGDVTVDGVHATDRRVVRRWMVDAGFGEVTVRADPGGRHPLAERLAGTLVAPGLVVTARLPSPVSSRAPSQVGERVP